MASTPPLERGEDAWSLVPTAEFSAGLRKLDRAVGRRVVKTLDAIVATGDPRGRGTGLQGPLSGLWRYRIGDHRVLCEIHDTELVVLALAVRHRSKAYRR
ncbi:MAG: type II toxin-antitoxin system RelE/ParE family toxin [Bifidobacteriaceae bacterium]|nr:type II toxin-antitoxin system RelE/ParE family toxin [Bifidobacteriaceae bacterium]